MAELRARLKPLFRRSSTATTTSSRSSAASSTAALGERRGHSKSSLLLSKARKSSLPASVQEEDPLPLPQGSIFGSETQSWTNDQPHTPDTSLETPRLTPLEKRNPTLTLEEPTPDLTPAPDPPKDPSSADPLSAPKTEDLTARSTTLPSRLITNPHQPNRVLHTLVESEKPESDEPGSSDYFGGGQTALNTDMVHQRKIWVKRTGQSATMVIISEEDLVDDAKDTILRKYANSLGRHYDAPDLTLRILPRDSARRLGKADRIERTLGPDEQLAKTLDIYFPGGQKVDDALIIDVPQRRTPRHSPRIPIAYYASDDLRPSESGADYFPPLPIQAQHSPRLPSTVSVTSGHGPSHPSLHSISIGTTGQVPALPSPGQLSGRGASSTSLRSQPRPRWHRQNTTSPTVVGMTKSVAHDNLNAHPATIPPAPPLPSPQIPSEGQPQIDHVSTPPRVASPRPGKIIKKPKRIISSKPTLPAGLLDGAVPPINVLIVEDNIINLKLLEAFMKRLKVRWHTAMNGREAVNKWRQGGFHLVLMDIQLPVMNGLDATKEIRRLERLNKIGVLSNSAANTPTFPNSIEAVSEAGDEEVGAPDGEDNLMNTAIFKSPVIIVALTASSLQSDRHEALAAGCNDFLTKPVNFVWLERKVMEWGCMQALIDFDGWRKWKDFSQAPASLPMTVKQPSPKGGNKSPTTGGPAVAANGAVVKGEKKQRQNLGLLKTGVPAKMDQRLSGAETELGVGSTSGSGSEGSGNGSIAAVGA
ncbi:MAG: hypothetical protein Q9207_004893 [Kuettlingeria erythrocarpa]